MCEGAGKRRGFLLAVGRPSLDRRGFARLVERVARAISELPVLVILAYRPPEYVRVQGTVRVEVLPHFTRLRLSELSPAQIEQALRAKLSQLYPECAARRRNPLSNG